MGVSAAQGSAGLKPGVCTSTTRPSNPYEGQMIYETDTDLTYIYGGSAWQQIAGSTAVGNSGLVYVTSATIGSGVSSVTVSGAFSTTYDNYLVTMGGGVSSVGCSLDLSLGSTTSGYKWCLIWTAWGATVFSDFNAAAANMRYMGRSDTNGQDAHIDIMSPFLSKNTRVLGSATSTSDTGTTTGLLVNSTSYTAFTITPSGGTLTGGTITVYGYRKA